MASFLSHVSELLGQSPDDTSRLVPTRGPLAGITDSAMLAGHQALRDGVSIATLVNSYTDAREVVIDLVGAAIAVDMRGFHLFNECVDCAIAGAVSAYGMQRERDLAYDGTERLGVLAHEMRNLLNTMTLSFAVIREGKVGLSGSTGAMLSRSLSGLCALVDRSVAEVRLETSSPALVPVSMVEFMEQIQVSAAVHAEGYGRQLTVHPVDRELSVVADWQLLESAVSNLLQNAFKFSRGQGQVSLVTRATADRVLIDVSDECGGLPAEAVTALFRPFSRAGSDRSGLGLGLFIAQAAARANLGEISVCDKPGTGCVFTIDLPRSSAVALAH
ncbi:MAG: HAMP domain-containing sensor histidine kinase [Polyangiaceae bacterium]